MSKKLFLLFLLITTGTHLLAQIQRKLEKTASKLDVAVNDLQSKKTLYGQDMLAIDTIIMHFNQMNALYQTSNELVSKEYLASLKNDLEVLKRILAANDNEDVSEQISFIKRSFQYKSVLLDTSMTTSVYKHVNTTIRVIIDGKDVNGYSITANPEMWFDKKPLYVFDPLSPTSKKMTPGDYVFYAYKDGVMVKKKRFPVGSEKGLGVTTISIFPTIKEQDE